MINFIEQLFKRYLFNSFYLGLPQLVSLAITLVTFPIILSRLNPEDYGVFQFVLATQVWLNALSAEYSVQGSQRGLARGDDGTFIFSLFYRLKFIIPIGLILLIISPFFYYFYNIKFAIIFLLMSLYFLIGYLPEVSYNNVFVAKKNYKQFSFWKIIDSIIIPITSAIVAYTTANVLWFAVAHFVSTSLVGWAGTIYVIKKYKLWHQYKANKIDRTVSAYGLKLIPSAFILQISNKITDFIIGPFFGFANLALYSVANSMETRARSLIKVIQLMIYPDFAKMEWLDLKTKIKSKLKSAFFISWLFVIFFALIGYVYIHLFLPKFYLISGTYLIILLLGFPAKVLQSILQTAFDSALKHKQMSYLLIAPSIIKILIIAVFGFVFGIYGMIWGLTLFAWAHFFFTYIIFVKHKHV